MIKIRELVAWILVAFFFIALLITTMIASTALCVYKYKKEQTKDNSLDYKMEGNPCYEAITLKKITVTPHVQTHDYR